jgi:hypothetical protein
MRVKITKQAFLQMDLSEIQGTWLRFFFEQKGFYNGEINTEGMVEFNKLCSQAMAEFHARGVDDVCTVLESALYERDLDINPFDKTISLAAAKGLLTKMRNSEDYRIFTVDFIKRGDGTYRKMKCRFGVTKYLAGGVKSFNDEEKALKTVFDLDKMGYRSIALENIVRMKIGGTNYLIEENKDCANPFC